MSRSIDDALIRRIEAAAYNAGVSRESVEFEWPECHKPKCQHRHGSPETAMSYMTHQIITEITTELRYETTTHPHIPADTDEQSAVITLSVLLRQYGIHKTSTYSNAAQLIIDSYPELVPIFARENQ